MENLLTRESGRAPEVAKLFVGDPLFERLQEINSVIASRAYQLFTSKGFSPGRELEDWLRAESEILHPIPLDVTDTEAELIVRVEVPGFTEKNLEVRVAPRCLLIFGERPEASEQKIGRTVYSERHANQIFRVLDLPARIDPDGVKATLSDGILEVTLSKVETAKKVPVLAKAAAA
jgi:HSP20 family protein